MGKGKGRGGRNATIIVDILKAAKDEPHAKTTIMQDAHLDWRNFNRYWSEMNGNNVIGKDASSGKYKTTKRGLEVIEYYNKMIKAYEGEVS